MGRLEEKTHILSGKLLEKTQEHFVGNPFHLGFLLKECVWLPRPHTGILAASLPLDGALAS